MAPQKCLVTRAGKQIEEDVTSLVVGDLVHIRYGDLIPADIRLLSSSDFKVNNSTLTGESETLRRSPECTSDDPLETRNLAFFSTNAVEGEATGLVIRVGPHTMVGQLATLAMDGESTSTPLGLELNNFIKVMTIWALIFGVIFFIVPLALGSGFKTAIFVFIGTVVANVPEGVSVIFTLTLSVASSKMGRRNMLVKHLQAVEGLGSCSVICSDKTGTITQNKMFVAHLWFNDEIVEADTGEFEEELMVDKEDEGFMALATVAMLCSRAKFKARQEAIPISKRFP